MSYEPTLDMCAKNKLELPGFPAAGDRDQQQQGATPSPRLQGPRGEAA